MARSRFDLEALLPAEPVAPRVFVEDVIPALFADIELSPAARAIELRVGIVLLGAERGADWAGERDASEGGEWTLHFIDGELGIACVRDEGCDVTIVQSVADWRAGLWERRAGEGARPTAPLGLAASEPNPALLDELRSLRGRLDVRIESASGTDAPWQIALQLGPGGLRDSADARVTLAAEEAEAIRCGALHPLEALMTGRLRLEGDLGLILQIQALALQATRPPTNTPRTPNPR